MDAQVDGMVYASIEHPPVLGGKLKIGRQHGCAEGRGRIADRRHRSIQAASGDFQPLGGVAVIADNTWAAFQGRKKLKIDWDNGPNATYNSDEYKKELQETARQPGKVIRSQGDVDKVFANGGQDH